MPNWVINQLKVSGKGADKILQKYIDSEKEYFDFNKVIPMPKELSETEESSSTPKEVFERNKRKYGYASWYDWAIDNWGTKWNAHDAYIVANGDEVWFQTAWSAALPIVEKLSENHPELEFEIKYADEDIGYNTGLVVYKNGKIIELYEPLGGSKEAYELYFDLWGEDGWEWNEETQSYEYLDD